MSALQDLIYQAAWNLQLYQGVFNNTAGQRPLMFNPRNSGQNIVIVQYTINNIGPIISTTQSPVPLVMVNAGGQALYTYLPGSNGNTPATSAPAGINNKTGTTGALTLNTGAGFPAAFTVQTIYGQGMSDIQVNSSRDIGELVDLAASPIILYPGDSFGTAINFFSNSIFVQYAYIQVTP